MTLQDSPASPPNKPLTPVDPRGDTQLLELSTGLRPDDIQRVRYSLDQSASANTRRMYSSAWKSFQACAQACTITAIPASPALVAGCLTHLAEERKLSVVTVWPQKAALAAVHKAAAARRCRRQRRRQACHARHLAGPLQTPETGKAPDRRGALAAVKATATNRRPWALRGRSPHLVRCGVEQ